MNWLKQIREQLLAIWARSNNPTRAAFVAVAAGCIVLVAAVGVWSSRPQYVPLAVDLTPAQTAAIIDKLNSARIEHKLNYSGSTILVPSRDFSHARPLVSDLATPANEPPDAPRSTLLDDPRDRGRKDRERSEQQIARSIMRLNAIKYASVTIGDTSSSPFLGREKKPKTASVVLEIHPGIQFDRRNAYSVAKIVAGSVPELAIENVNIVDTQGHDLSRQGAAGGNLADIYLEAIRKKETEIYAKLHHILRAKLGENASAISVTAELKPEVLTRNRTMYDAESGAKKVEKIESRKVTGASRVTSDPAGTASNLNVNSPQLSNPQYSETTEDIETEFQPGETHEVFTEYLGKVTRLSIAATVDLSAAEETTRDDIEALIKSASGFDEQRGDNLTLLVGKIASVPSELDQIDSGPPWWDGYERLARSLSLGVAAVVALVIGLLVIRKLRPVTLVQPQEETDSGERRQRLLSELSTKARENPEAVSRILATWLNDPGRDAAAGQQEHDTQLEQPRRRAA